jgi:putative flippase GtrA
MHRSLFGRRRKPDLVRIAARLVKANLVVVGILSVGVTVLIVDFALDRTVSVVALIVGAVVVLGLWLVLPMMVSRRDRP